MINKNHRTLYILQFKRSSDRNEGFLGVKEDKANEPEQDKSIIEALKAVAQEWKFKQIHFVVQGRGAVVENNFYSKLERLSVQARKRDQNLAAHVQRICHGEAHDTLIRSNYENTLGLTGSDTMTLMEIITIPLS